MHVPLQSVIGLKLKHVPLPGFHQQLVSLPSRNSEYRIAPIVSLSGSVVTAFDDVSVEDSDFRYIEGKNDETLLRPKMFVSWNQKLNFFFFNLRLKF